MTNSRRTFGPTSALQGADSCRYDTSNDELLAIERTWTAVFPTIQLEPQSSMGPKSLHEKTTLEALPTGDGKDVGMVLDPIPHEVVPMSTKVSPNAKPFWARAAQLVRRGRSKHEKLEEDELQASNPTSAPGVLIDQVWIPKARIKN